MSATPLIIANPAAGNGRALSRMRALEPVLAGWSAPPRLVWTQRPGHAVELAREARRAGAQLLVAAGGDGTVHEVVNGMLADGRAGAPALVCLPLGTGNDFARALALGPDLQSLAADPDRSPERRVDLARARLAGADDCEWLVNAANVGLGARVAARVVACRPLQVLGRGAYGAAALSMLPGYRPRHLLVRIDGATAWDGPALNVSICNGPFFGGGMRPVLDASLASGKLHVVVVHPMSAWRVAGQLGLVVRGRVPDPRRITAGIGGEVLVAASGKGQDPETPVDRAAELELDGAPRGGLPVLFEVHAAALRVRVPAGSAVPDRVPDARRSGAD